MPIPISKPGESSKMEQEPVPAKPRRRFVGSSTRPSAARGKGGAAPARRLLNQIPDEILKDEALNEAIKGQQITTPCWSHDDDILTDMHTL